MRPHLVNILLKTTFNVLNTSTKGWRELKRQWRGESEPGGGRVRDILIVKERNKINIKLYARHNNYASPRLICYYY